MKKILITIIGLAAFTAAKAQQSTPKLDDPNFDLKVDTPKNRPHRDTSKVFFAVLRQPIFPGGTEKLFEFLKANIRYPAEAFEKKIQGKVFVPSLLTRMVL